MMRRIAKAGMLTLFPCPSPYPRPPGTALADVHFNVHSSALDRRVVLLDLPGKSLAELIAFGLILQGRFIEHLQARLKQCKAQSLYLFADLLDRSTAPPEASESSHYPVLGP